MEPKNRLSWNEYFSKIVEVTAERSSCKRLQVGCLLVKDNRIISQGYNGFLPGYPHESIKMPLPIVLKEELVVKIVLLI